MNYIDILLWLIIFLAVWNGWQKGFIVGIIDLVSWVGSIALAFFYYQMFTQFIDNNIKALGVWTAPLSFIIILIASRIIISSILVRLFPKEREVHQNRFNQFLGLVPGLITGIINAAIIAALLLAFPLSNTISATTRESNIASLLAGKVEWIDDKIAPVFDPVVKKSINNLVIRPESDKTVHLNFNVKNAKPREDLEAKMILLVNEERAKQGLSILKADPSLVEVGRKHSHDMFARGYFSHYSLEGRSVSDRLRNNNIKFLFAGENLALAQTLNIAHKGLMESPGHKANILQHKYGRIGIGILDGGTYGLMITQVFRN